MLVVVMVSSDDGAGPTGSDGVEWCQLVVLNSVRVTMVVRW